MTGYDLKVIRRRLEQYQSHDDYDIHDIRWPNGDVAGLLGRIAELEDALGDLTAGSSEWDRQTQAPEDAEVDALCQRWGYGAVMDSASRVWARRDGDGSFVVGTCRVFAHRALAVLRKGESL